MNDARIHTEAFHAFAATGSGRFARASRTRAGASHRLVESAIALAKEGDTAALHYLYLRYADAVNRYIQSIVRDPHEAEDITQTVFAKLMFAIRKWDGSAVPFTAWILRIARNAALDYVRARRTVPCEEVRTSDEGDDKIGFERGKCLKDALARLPEGQREVLVLRHIVGLAPAEIAELLGKTENAVHGLHHRGRCALQKTLRELGAAPATVAASPSGLSASQI
jgi:RNA polymerase sigma-70 factor (ECF subfamily)